MILLSACANVCEWERERQTERNGTYLLRMRCQVEEVRWCMDHGGYSLPMSVSMRKWSFVVLKFCLSIRYRMQCGLDNFSYGLWLQSHTHCNLRTYNLNGVLRCCCCCCCVHVLRKLYFLRFLCQTIGLPFASSFLLFSVSSCAYKYTVSAYDMSDSLCCWKRKEKIILKLIIHWKRDEKTRRGKPQPHHSARAERTFERISKLKAKT